MWLLVLGLFWLKAHVSLIPLVDLTRWVYLTHNTNPNTTTQCTCYCKHQITFVHERAYTEDRRKKGFRHEIDTYSQADDIIHHCDFNRCMAYTTQQTVNYLDYNLLMQVHIYA